MVSGKYSFQTGQRHTFTGVDYFLFAAMLIVSAGIGIFYAIKDRKRKSPKDFLLAGGNMSSLPVALSLLASFMSAITLLGTPAEMYNYTTMYWYIGLGYLLVIAASAHLYIPVFYRLQITSVFEYLETRFSKGVRTAGSLTFCVQMLLYMAIVLYAPSLALNAVTGFTLWGSVISVGLVCTLYTTLGGMKAVLWTDTFQVFLILIGQLAVLIQGCIEVGGLARAWQIAADNKRIYFSDFSVDPSVRHSAWSLVIGGAFTWIATYGTNQAQVQRALTCPTLKKAQLAIWLNFPGLCVIMFFGCLTGIVMYAFYSTCDPKSFHLVSASDQLLPLFVMDVLGHVKGIPGLFVASLFSGALSTISSGLNSLSAVFLQDVIKIYVWKNLSSERETAILKILALFFGLVCLGLSAVASLLGGVLQAALSLFGMIGGPLLGVFTLGMIFPHANKWGAFFGLFTGLIFMFWIGIGAQVIQSPSLTSPIRTDGCNWNLTVTGTQTPTVTTLLAVSGPSTSPAETPRNPVHALYSLSYLWYSSTAVLIVLVVGLAVSFITGRTDPKEVDPRLLMPIFDILFPYLPEKLRRPLRFGVDYSLKDRCSLSTSQTTVKTSSSHETNSSEIGRTGSSSLNLSTISGSRLAQSGSVLNSTDSPDVGVNNPAFRTSLDQLSYMSRVSYESSV